MYETKIITKIEELELIKEQWNQLLERSETKSIFLKHEWISNCWKFFGKDKEMFVVMVRNHGKIQGIAPLMIAKKGGRKTLQFIGTPLSDYCDFIIGNNKEAVLKRIYDCILDEKARYSSMFLEEIPESSSSLKLTRKILGKDCSIVFCNGCMSLDLKGLTEQEIRKKIKKRSLTKKIKKLQEQGNLALDNIQNPEMARNALNIFFEQHIKIWDRKGIPSMFKENVYREFLSRITSDLMVSGIVEVWVLKLDDKLLSVQFGFNYNNIYLSYQKSYDLEYYRHSPGEILTQMMIREFHAKGMDEVDFSRGAESYKMRFANKVSSNMGIVFEKNFTGRMLSRIYHKTKEKIMKNEKLHSYITRLRSRIKLSYPDKS